MPRSKTGFINISGGMEWKEITPNNYSSLPSKIKQICVHSKGFDAQVLIKDSDDKENKIESDMEWQSPYFFESYIDTEKQIYKVKSINDIVVEFST